VRARASCGFVTRRRTSIIAPSCVFLTPVPYFGTANCRILAALHDWVYQKPLWDVDQLRRRPIDSNCWSSIQQMTINHMTDQWWFRLRAEKWGPVADSLNVWYNVLLPHWLRSFEWPDRSDPVWTVASPAGGEKERPGRVRPGLASQQERSHCIVVPSFHTLRDVSFICSRR